MTYFIYNKSEKRGYKQIRTTKSQLTQCTKYNSHQNLHRNKEHAPTVKMVHNNYNTTLCKRSKTTSKTSTKTIGANIRLGRVIVVRENFVLNVLGCHETY